jgi:hypothetical protein
MSGLYQKLTELFREVINLNRLLGEVYQNFNEKTRCYDLTKADHDHFLLIIKNIELLNNSIDHARYTKRSKELLLKSKSFLRDLNNQCYEEFEESIQYLVKRLPHYMLECMQTQEGSNCLKESKTAHPIISNIAKKVLFAYRPHTSTNKVTIHEDYHKNENLSETIHKDLESDDDHNEIQEKQDEDFYFADFDDHLTKAKHELKSTEDEGEAVDFNDTPQPMNAYILNLNNKFEEIYKNFNALFNCFYQGLESRNPFDWRNYYIHSKFFQRKITALESELGLIIPQKHILKAFKITPQTKINEIKKLFSHLNKELELLYRRLYSVLDIDISEEQSLLHQKSLDGHQQAKGLENPVPSEEKQNREFRRQSSYGHMMQQQTGSAVKNRSPMNKTAFGICVLSSASFGISLGYLIKEKCWTAFADYLTPDGASPIYGDIFLSVMLLALIAIATISGYIAYKATQVQINPVSDNQPLLENENHSDKEVLKAS